MIEEQLEAIRVHAEKLERAVDAINQTLILNQTLELTPDQYQRFVTGMAPAQSACSIGTKLLYRDLKRTHKREAEEESSGAPH